MISEKLLKRHTALHKDLEHSNFEVNFHDSSSVNEKTHSWEDFSEQKTVKYFGGEKQVKVSKHEVSKITISHNGISATLDIPKGCEVYQAIRSETIFFPNGQKKDTILGRCVGIVKDGEVIEERFVNALERQVFGLKK